jgi:serine/threonine protein kinase
MRTNDLKVQEIRILLHLKHCNIIEMRDFYTSNAQLCIVMEYADGGDLRSEIVNARNEKAIISEEIISVWIIQVGLKMICFVRVVFALAKIEA